MVFRIKSLAPRVCPRCGSERTFAIMADRVLCRHCGYSIPREDDAAPQRSSAAAPQSDDAAARSMLGQLLGEAQDVSPSTGEAGDSATRAAPSKTGYGSPGDTRLRPTLSGAGGLDNNWAMAAYRSAVADWEFQRWEAAARAFKRVLEHEPTFYAAHYWLGLLSQDPVEKRRHLETAVAGDPGNASAVQALMELDGKISAEQSALLANPYQEAEVRAAGGAVATSLKAMRCAACGASAIEMDPVTGRPVCVACGTMQAAARSAGSGGGGSVIEALLKRRAQPVRWVVDERLLACRSCGAERLMAATTLADECPYCGSRYVVLKDILDSFEQPDGIVPFKIAEADAAQAVAETLQRPAHRLWGLFNDNRVRRQTLEPDFLPFWVFDAALTVRRTTVRDAESDWNRGLRQIQPMETEEIAELSGDVLVPAVKSPPPGLLGRLGAFDLSRSVDYAPEHLGDHSAQIYSIDVDRASLNARHEISQAMREKYGAGITSGLQVQVTPLITSMSYRLLLLPVWIATLHEADGEVRTGLIHGQTGQVVLGKPKRPRLESQRG